MPLYILNRLQNRTSYGVIGIPIIGLEETKLAKALVLFVIKHTLLPLQGEISLILPTLRAASLYAGLIAGCPFRASAAVSLLLLYLRAESPKALSSGQSVSVAPSECSSTTVALKGQKRSVFLRIFSLILPLFFHLFFA